MDEKRLFEIESRLLDVFARPMILREQHDDLFEVYGLTPMGADRELEEYLVGKFFKREVAEYFVESVEAMRQLIEEVKRLRK